MYIKVFICSAYILYWMNGIAYASTSEFSVVPRNRSVPDGGSVIFKCKSTMKEKHEYSWTFNDDPVETNDRILVVGNQMCIYSASPILDMGRYVCIATSLETGARQASPPAYLRVSYFPTEETKRFRIPLDVILLSRGKRGGGVLNKEISIDENSSTQIPCNFLQNIKLKNMPNILIKWEKDGKIFREMNIVRNKYESEQDEKPSASGSNILTDDSRVYISRRNGSLIFSSTTASDEGLYICHALTTENESITLSHAKLNIIETLKFTPQPTSKNLELGSVGKVHCRAQGTPNPHIKWTKENGDNLPEYVEDRNGTLLFRNATVDHNGNYTCIASNTQGEISATVSITIVVAPKFSIFNEGPINVTEMSKIILHCQATGDPEPTIQWDKDLVYLHGNLTENNRFHVLENGSLLIEKVYLEDEGLYGCTIGNSAGLKREEIQLLVKPSELYANEEASDGFVITRAVLITMSVAFAYIIFVVGLMIWCRYKRSKGRARLTIMSKTTEETCDENLDKEIEPCLNEKSEKISPKSNSKYNHNETKSSVTNSVNSKSNKSRILNTNYELILKNELTLLYELGRGCFGDVLVMKLNHDTTEKRSSSQNNLNDTDEIKAEKSNNEITCLVKTLKKTKEENVKNEFKRQLDLFGNLKHDNISKFYGLCQDESFHAMILEWTDWGDFKQFLIATNNSENKNIILSDEQNVKPPPSLKMAQMLTAAHQISKGLDAIYRGRFIHKDLAARNCIITSNFIVKISYPALSKDKYQLEYYKHLNDLIPLRWMGPECLVDEDYSIKSDIYSFGVLVWEIFTNAANLPNASYTNEEFISLLKENKLERNLAENTPEDLKEILQLCWSKNPKERPQLSQIITSLGNSLNREYSIIKTES